MTRLLFCGLGSILGLLLTPADAASQIVEPDPSAVARPVTPPMMDDPVPEAVPEVSPREVTVTGTPAVLTLKVISNAPVQDTPENRALYAPLFNAGKRSAAAGN